MTNERESTTPMEYSDLADSIGSPTLPPSKSRKLSGKLTTQAGETALEDAPASPLCSETLATAEPVADRPAADQSNSLSQSSPNLAHTNNSSDSANVANPAHQIHPTIHDQPNLHINVLEVSNLSQWRNYFETAQHLISRLEEKLRNTTGSDLSDLNILISLAEAPNHTLQMTKLAQQLVFSVARLSYRVRVLEERGWIAKVACPNDRRASNLQLTPDGIDALARLGATHRQHIQAAFFDRLTPTEVATLSAISEKLK